MDRITQAPAAVWGALIGDFSSNRASLGLEKLSSLATANNNNNDNDNDNNNSNNRGGLREINLNLNLNVDLQELQRISNTVTTAQADNEENNFHLINEEEDLLFGTLKVKHLHVEEELLRICLESLLLPTSIEKDDLEIIRVWLGDKLVSLRSYLHLTNNTRNGTANSTVENVTKSWWKRVPQLSYLQQQLDQVAKGVSTRVNYDRDCYLGTTTPDGKTKSFPGYDGRVKTIMANSNPTVVKDTPGVLFVKVMRIKNLVGVNSNKKSDPYCTLGLNSILYVKEAKYKTKQFTAVTECEFLEEFEIPVPASTDKSQPHQLLCINVMDNELAGKDNVLGEVLIPLQQLEDGMFADCWFRIDTDPSDERTRPLVNHQPAGFRWEMLSSLAPASSESTPLCAANFDSPAVTSFKGTLEGVNLNTNFAKLAKEKPIRGVIQLRLHYLPRRQNLQPEKNVFAPLLQMQSRFQVIKRRIYKEDKAHNIFTLLVRRLMVEDPVKIGRDDELSKIRRRVSEREWILKQAAVRLGIDYGTYQPLALFRLYAKLFPFIKTGKNAHVGKIEAYHDLCKTVENRLAFSKLESAIFAQSCTDLLFALEAAFTNYPVAFTFRDNAEQPSFYLTKCLHLYKTLMDSEGNSDFTKHTVELIRAGIEERYTLTKRFPHSYIMCEGGNVGGSGMDPSSASLETNTVEVLIILCRQIAMEINSTTEHFAQYFQPEINLVDVVAWQSYKLLQEDIKLFYDNWKDDEGALILYDALKSLHDLLREKMEKNTIRRDELLDLPNLFSPCLASHIETVGRKMSDIMSRAIALDSFERVCELNTRASLPPESTEHQTLVLYSTSVHDSLQAMSTIVVHVNEKLSDLCDAQSVIKFGDRVIRQAMLTYAENMKTTLCAFIEKTEEMMFSPSQPDPDLMIRERLSVACSNLSLASFYLGDLIGELHKVKVRDEERKTAALNEMKEEIANGLDDAVVFIIAVLVERYRPSLQQNMINIFSSTSILMGRFDDKIQPFLDSLDEVVDYFFLRLYSFHRMTFLRKLWASVANIIETFVENDRPAATAATTITTLTSKIANFFSSTRPTTFVIETEAHAITMLCVLSKIPPHFNKKGKGLELQFIQLKGDRLLSLLELFSISSTDLVKKVEDPDNRANMKLKKVIIKIMKLRAAATSGKQDLVARQYLERLPKTGSNNGIVAVLGTFMQPKSAPAPATAPATTTTATVAVADDALLPTLGLAADEVVVGKWECRYAVVRQGFVYVTNKRVCFAAVLFEEEKNKVAIPLGEIKSLTKTTYLMTGLDNCMELVSASNNTKHGFTLFVSPAARNDCHQAICAEAKKMQNILDNPTSNVIFRPPTAFYQIYDAVVIRQLQETKDDVKFAFFSK